jgi:Flp pilus assembly pilin Flp
MKRLLAAVNHLLRREDGQDLLEYGLLAVLIAVVVLAGMTSLGNTIMNVFWTPIAQTF